MFVFSHKFQKVLVSSLTFIKSFFEYYRNKNKNEKNNSFNNLEIKNKFLVKFKDINKIFSII